MNDKVKTRICWETPDGRKGAFVDDFGFCYQDEFGLNSFWWDEGNGGCDCQRASSFLGEENWNCGDTIKITDIEPLEKIITNPSDLLKN